MAAAASVVLAAAVSGCALGRPAEPALTGPSEFGTSLSMTATPDLLSRDGHGTSTVTVTARDAAAQPVRNLALRFDVMIDGRLGDLGTLSARTVTTNNDGKASVTYTAPPPSLFGLPNEATVQIVATPAGSDATNANRTLATINLVSPGTIQVPDTAPVPQFLFSPSTPFERDTVNFDASASSDADGVITTYRWDFGDGASSSSSSATTSHRYDLAGTYAVTLTVTDDRGASVRSAAVSLQVAAASDPVPAFVISPTGPHFGETVFFNASGTTVPPGRAIVEYLWDFGDGTSASTADPNTSHVYAGTVSRTLTVTLTVTDSIGRKAAKSITVTITP